jgi:tetratricopeptide (TPR) repeat protein
MDSTTRFIRLAREKTWAALLLVAAVAVAPYLLLPGAPLVYDASPAILENAAVQNGPVGDLFTSDFWGYPLDAPHATGSYRPLVSLTWFLQGSIHGNSAPLYHLADMASHAGASCLLLILLGSLGVDPRWRIPAVLVFAAHPVLSEAVCSAVGRADIMAAAALFGALILHLQAPAARKPWLFETGALLAVSGGFLCKEYAVSFPFILLAVGLACGVGLQTADHRRRRIVWICALGLLAAYLLLRHFLIGSVGSVPMVGPRDQPLFGEPFPVRWSTAAWLLVHSARLLFLPLGLNYHYDFGSLAIVRSPAEARAMAGIVLVLALAILSLRFLRGRRSPLPPVAAVLFLFPLAPSLHTVTVGGVLFAERWLYIPTAGLVVAAAWAAGRLGRAPSLRRPVAVVLAVTAVLGGIGTFTRVRDWYSLERLARATLATYSDSPAVLLHLATELGMRGKYEEALAPFERSIELQGDKAWTWKNYAACLSNLGRHEDAAAAWRRVVDLAPTDIGILWKGLGEAEMRAGNAEAAVKALRRAHEQIPEDRSIRTILGNALLRQGQSILTRGERIEALALAEEAVSLAELPPEGLFLAGQLAYRAGDGKQAKEWFRTAMERDPGILRGKHGEAMSLLASERPEEAAAILREILIASPDHAPTHFNLGRALLMAGRPGEAAIALRNGLAIRDDPRARTLLREVESAR